ncbi:hypothetical protein Tco_1219471, partial [Tanacetum coccineum]
LLMYGWLEDIIVIRAVLHSDVEELKKLVKKMEVSLTPKEHENNELKEQVWKFEARWSEQETKMKLVEETWQSQMSSLQIRSRSKMHSSFLLQSDAHLSLAIINDTALADETEYILQILTWIDFI